MSGRRPLALFLPALVGGGAERVTLNLAEGFVRRGLAVDLVLVARVGELKDRVPDGVRVVDLGSSRALLSIPALAGYLRRERPAALISALNYANLVALWARALAGTRTPTLVVVHNHLSAEVANASSWRSRLLPALMRAGYRRADAVAAVSAGVADDLAATLGLARERVRVLYNPVVSRATLARAEEDPGDPWLRQDAPPVIVGVGRLTPQKDFPLLLRAFARVRRRRPCRLLILGEGERRSELEALAEELGVAADVRLPGFVANPYAVLRRAAAFALSSRWEGLPTVVIEALAVGAPVVATDCESGPREILAGGRYGQLVPVGDEAALAGALERALAGEAPRVDAAEASRPYTFDAAVDAYLALLRGLEPDRRRRGASLRLREGSDSTSR